MIQHDMPDQDRRDAYNADITYGTNNEFGFDYLRDNMKFSAQECVQRRHRYAIVDEVDSILVDEARTPLIISGPSEESTGKYTRIDRLIPRLIREEDFKVDEKARSVVLQETGIEKAEKFLGVENVYDPRNMALVHHIHQALKAHALFKRNVDLHGQGRTGHHRRRVHGPSDARPPLLGRAPSGPGGQGRGSRSSGRTRPWPPSPSRTTFGCTTSWRG